SPILPVLLESPIGPNIVYHNIVGVIPDDGWYVKLVNKESGNGDGVVSYASAHLDGVASEIVVNADHVNIHRHPATILEVRRILMEHLHEVGVNMAAVPPWYAVPVPSTQH